MLNEQYRMHPMISHFPRNIFYSGDLLDAPNVKKPDYGDPLRSTICRAVPGFKPLVILDLDSREERTGTSLANSAEAQLCVFLYQQLKQVSHGLSSKTKVAIISPYAEQVALLRRCFTDVLGPDFAKFVEINTVDAFQGREANIVIFSAVRAAGSRGVGFLSDVRRMNVALTRAKHFLFVIARCKSVVVNPYWKELVEHAREKKAVFRIPVLGGSGRNVSFGNIKDWIQEMPSSTFVAPPHRPVGDESVDPRKRKYASKDP
jgi:senataxin